jgi:hypothetical protein
MGNKVINSGIYGIFDKPFNLSLGVSSESNFNSEISKEVTKSGISVLKELLDKMEKEGLESQAHTIIEDGFPVTYHDNGIITMDYKQLRLLDNK